MLFPDEIKSNDFVYIASIKYQTTFWERHIKQAKSVNRKVYYIN